MNWQQIFFQNDINERVNLITNKIINMFDIHAPYRRVKIIKPQGTWFKGNLRILKQQHNSLLT